MDAKRRQRILRMIELAGRYPSCAYAIGIKVSTRKKKEADGKRPSELTLKLRISD